MMYGQPYTRKADLWSSAICLYALAVGRLPFDDSNISRLIEKIKYEDPTFPENMNQQLTMLLKMMLKKDQSQRADINKIRATPWFNSYFLADKMNYNFGIEEGWRNPCDGKFVPDKAILYDLQNYQDTKHLVELMSQNVYNNETILYRILKRNKMTDEMKWIQNRAKNLVNTAPPSYVPKAVPDIKHFISKYKNHLPNTYQEDGYKLTIRKKNTESGESTSRVLQTVQAQTGNFVMRRRPHSAVKK